MTGWQHFADPDTEFEILASETPHTEDGYWPGEPKALRCPECGAQVQLDRDPSTPGIDELAHRSDCPQRFVHSHWYRQQLD